MSSYGGYPPGVTGNEYQIAGYPERVVYAVCESETIEESTCTFEGELDSVSGDGETWEWTCPLCGYEGDTVIDPGEPEDY